MKKLRKSNNIKIRSILQIFFFVLIALISINHTLVESGKGISFFSSASLHAICPFGGVVTIQKLLTTGTYVKKVHEATIVLLGITTILAVLFGPVFCGWVCPFGTIQEWFGKIGKKIFRKRFNRFIPYKYDRYLRYFRYFVLVWVVYMTSRTGILVFSNVDPYYALFNLWTGDVAIGGYISLAIILIASLFIERPWCKYFCPLGALFGLSNLFRIFKIRRKPSTCVSCKACDNICPMNIEVSKHEIVRNHQCISCLQCTSEQACPISNTVEFKASSFRQKEVLKNEN